MKNILIVSSIPTHPQNAGNKSRLFSLIKNLQEQGYNVYFLYLKNEINNYDHQMNEFLKGNLIIHNYRKPINPLFFIKKIIRKLSVINSSIIMKYSIDEIYDRSIDKVVKNLTKKIKFDVVIVEYVFMSKVLENFNKDVLKVIDTHDVFTDRHKIYLKNGERAQWFYTSKQQEAKGLNRADVIVAIQEKEKDFLSSLTDKRVITIGHLVNLKKLNWTTKGDKKLLFVGSENDINVHAIKYFINDILPIIKEKIPNVKLLLAGRISDKIEDREDIIKLGELNDISEAYEKANLVINPLRFGTGLKVKTIEALGYAAPLVTTPIGAEGIKVTGKEVFKVAKTEQEFADSVINLLENEAELVKLSNNAYNFAVAWNRNNLRNLIDLIEKTNN